MLGLRFIQRNYRPLLLLQRRSAISRLMSPFLGTFGLAGFIALETAVAAGINLILAYAPVIITSIATWVTPIIAAMVPMINQMITAYINTTMSIDHGIQPYLLWLGLNGLNLFGVWVLSLVCHHWEALIVAFTQGIYNAHTVYDAITNTLVGAYVFMLHICIIPVFQAIRDTAVGGLPGLYNSFAGQHIVWIYDHTVVYLVNYCGSLLFWLRALFQFIPEFALPWWLPSWNLIVAIPEGIINSITGVLGFGIRVSSAYIAWFTIWLLRILGLA